MSAFRFPIDVRFGACDPVGIVYFPRYFDWFHQAMEAWFGEALGVPYHEILRTHGFPAVHTECDYQRPCAFGDQVVVELRVGRIGRTSVRLNYRVLGPDGEADVRATGHTVVVCFETQGSAAEMRAVALPVGVRAAMERFGVA
jgi:4-hydroxybenzoyl-CoA thioesterase